MTMWTDYRGRAVLVTGGTRGIGLATAKAFSRCGADVFITAKWGSVSERTLHESFAADGLAAPVLLDADARVDDDTAQVMATIGRTHATLHAFVSNVAFAPVVAGLDEYTLRGLLTGIEYSAWPLVSHTLAARRQFGHAPRYVIGMSSEGAETLHFRYDLVAVSKAALETLARYLHQRLRDGGTRVNVVRTRFVDTEALRSSFSEVFIPFVTERAPGIISTPEVVADAVLALCSGWLDGMGGQVIRADGGAHVFDNFSRLYTLSQEHQS
ncbi:MAG: SDR family oxidoreductase [Gemmatimonadaceae bacterium]|nr:SDR family oxidoreductase [Gemmatimonadaceae bacterium]